MDSSSAQIDSASSQKPASEKVVGLPPPKHGKSFTLGRDNGKTKSFNFTPSDSQAQQVQGLMSKFDFQKPSAMSQFTTSESVFGSLNDANRESAFTQPSQYQRYPQQNMSFQEGAYQPGMYQQPMYPPQGMPPYGAMPPNVVYPPYPQQGYPPQGYAPQMQNEMNGFPQQGYPPPIDQGYPQMQQGMVQTPQQAMPTVPIEAQQEMIAQKGHELPINKEHSGPSIQVLEELERLRKQVNENGKKEKVFGIPSVNAIKPKHAQVLVHSLDISELKEEKFQDPETFTASSISIEDIAAQGNSSNTILSQEEADSNWREGFSKPLGPVPLPVVKQDDVVRRKHHSKHSKQPVEKQKSQKNQLILIIIIIFCAILAVILGIVSFYFMPSTL